MIVAKSPVHDCSVTDHPATRGPAFARGLALVGGTDMPAQRRGPAEQESSLARSICCRGNGCQSKTAIRSISPAAPSIWHLVNARVRMTDVGSLAT
jgi:hypothetical protein